MPARRRKKDDANGRLAPASAVEAEVADTAYNNDKPVDTQIDSADMRWTIANNDGSDIDMDGAECGSWKILYWLVAIAAAAFYCYAYFYELELRPFHHDEAVNTIITKPISNKGRTNAWKYDPQNYHGPSLFYITVWHSWVWQIWTEGLASWQEDPSRSQKFFDSMYNLRTVTITAMFSMLLVTLFFAKRRLGYVGALCAFLLLGMNTDNFWIARYWIHEMYFTASTLATYVFATWYTDTRSYWSLAATMMSIALMLATKEWAVVHLTIFVIADWTASLATDWLNGGAACSSMIFGAPKAWFRGIYNAGILRVLFGIFCFFAVWTPLFSSMGHNWNGCRDFFKTYYYWGIEGATVSGHNKHFLFWFDSLLFEFDMTAWATFVAAIPVALVTRDYKGLFLVFWTIGMLGAYSILPYKTAWCVPNLVLPLCITGAYGINQAVVHIQRSKKIKAKGLVFLALFGCLAALQVIDICKGYTLNFEEYDDWNHAQDYLASDRDMHAIVSDVSWAAHDSGEYTKTSITMVTTVGNHPLPYDLERNGYKISWHTDSNQNTPYYAIANFPVVVIGEERQAEQLDRWLDVPEKYSKVLRRCHMQSVLAVYINNEKTNRQAHATSFKLRTHFSPVANYDPWTMSEGRDPAVAGLTRTIWEGMDYGATGKETCTYIGTNAMDFEYHHRDPPHKAKPWGSPLSMEYHGLLRIYEEGVYAFYSASDDGSLMWLNDELFLDNDGYHGTQLKYEKAHLTPGYYTIKIRYFDYVGGMILKFTWRAPNGYSEPIPMSNLVTWKSGRKPQAYDALVQRFAGKQ